MVRKCPRCRLVNPPEAMRCDCGYDFASGHQLDSYLTAKDQARRAEDAKAQRDQYRIFGLILRFFRF